MSLRINTNVTAYNALRNLQQTSESVATSVERLSSGLRINRGQDDPAGLIISEGLRAQMDGINQAINNSQEANNLIKTAEGGLSEINSLLRSVRAMAVHAANTGVNDAAAVQADQTQIKSAIDSIQRIATQTQFGTKKLLDGTSGISASVVDTSRIQGITIGGTFGGYATQAGTVSVAVTTEAARASVTGSGTFSSVTATVATAGSVVINGQTIGVDASDTVQTLVNKINNLASVTNVGASFSGSQIVLTQQQYGANYKIQFAESASIVNGGTSTTATGTNAVATVTAMALVSNVSTATTATFTGGQSTGDSGLRLSDTSGNSILLSEFGNTGLSSARAVGTMTANALQFQIGGNAGQFVNLSLGNVQTDQIGKTSVAGRNLSTIDVTTASGAADALKVVDEAVSEISKLRAQLGAFQKNTLASTIRFLGVGIENLSASESQIRDANYAQEVTALTKNQILQQAGTSVLAQANQAPQMVLSLLR